MLKLLDISNYVSYFKNSTHTTYLLTKWLKNPLKQFIDQMKKAKKLPESWK